MLAAPGATIDVAPGAARFVAPYQLILGQTQQYSLSQVQQGLLRLSLLVTLNRDKSKQAVGTLNFYDDENSGH